MTGDYTQGRGQQVERTVVWHPVTVLPTDDNGEELLTTDGTWVELAHWEVDEPMDGVRFWYEGSSVMHRGTETHWADLPDPPTPLDPFNVP